MKLNKKMLAVAVGAAMMATGVAEAKIEATATPLTFTGSELLLTVWDLTAQTSYNLDLGEFTSQFVGNQQAERSYTISDNNFSSFLASMNAGDNVRYSVVAGSKSLSAGSAASKANYGLLTTLNANFGMAEFQADMSSTTKMNTAMGKLDNYITAANTGANESAGSVATNASVFAASGQQGYAGTFGSNWEGAFATINATANIGEAMAFYRAYAPTGSNTSRTYSSSLDLATPMEWKFNVVGGVGTLQYSAVSQVPVPGAVWMFVTGVMGLLGVSRRKAAV